jgi:uncharacterized protein YutE (UPF0331/DUF86 family)
MNREEVESKADVVLQSLALLDRIGQQTYEEFCADPLRLPAALHLLQTAIQALLDLGSMAIASLGAPAPARSRDILENLETTGHIPAGSSSRFGPMVSFRNRVVHLYDRIDPRRVHRILRENRTDLRVLLELLLALLDPIGQ